jgi:hypothetical protein
MIQVEWGNSEKTVVLWRFSYPWAWTEFYAAKAAVDAMIDSVSGMVDSIFLTSEEQRIPKDAIIHFRNIIGQQHPRSHRIVVVGAKPRLAMLVNVILSLIPKARDQFRYVTSLDEAYALLAKDSEPMHEKQVS